MDKQSGEAVPKGGMVALSSNGSSISQPKKPTGQAYSAEEMSLINNYVDESVAEATEGTKVSISLSIHHDNPLEEGGLFNIVPSAKMSRIGRDKGPWEVDPIFPQNFSAAATLWGIDEGFAQFLTGLIRSIRPLSCFETGTNKGRSTRAIAEGLVANGTGHLTTIDMIDHGVSTSGALAPEHGDYVTPVVGKIPDIFQDHQLDGLIEIDFAFLDAGHTAKDLEIELNFVEQRRAKECLVVVDNARDAQWPELAEFFSTYIRNPHINLETMTGAELIWMRGE